MSYFNIKRFARTAFWMYRINVKNVLSFAAGLSFGYLFTFIGWLWPLLRSGVATQETAVRFSSSLNTCTFIYVLLIVFSGTWIFADIKTKGQRIALKMLPATDLEKFLVRFIAITLGTSVAGIVAFCIADVLRVAVCLAVGIDYVGFGLAEFITNIANASNLVTWESGNTSHYLCRCAVVCLGTLPVYAWQRVVAPLPVRHCNYFALLGCYRPFMDVVLVPGRRLDA